MATREQPPQSPPPVQRLQVRYCKRGRARFTSHRDVARALERALRRADIPMAYSSGFNPHPRISYAGASATGAATEADYLELGLARSCDPGWVRDAMSAALPEGIDVLEVVERGIGEPSLTDRLEASTWQIAVAGPSHDVARRAVAAALAAASLPVERLTKNGVRQFDARPAVLALEAPEAGTIVATLRQEVPLVRPDDVVQALGRVEPDFVLDSAALYARLNQGLYRDGRIVSPFEKA